MELEFARDLKRRRYDDFVAPWEEVRAREKVRNFAVAAAPVDRILAPLPSITLGLAHKKGKQYHLAVRCQRSELVNSRQVAKIRKRAKKEVDVHFIGRLRKWLVPA